MRGQQDSQSQPTPTNHLSFEQLFNLAHENVQAFQDYENYLKQHDYNKFNFSIGEISHIHLAQRIALAFLLSNDVHFQTFQNELGSSLTNVPDMVIELDPAHANAKIFSMPRPVTAETRVIIKDNVVNMVKRGVIRPSLKPKMISPVHMVKYADKKPRFTIGMFIFPLQYRQGKM